MVYEFDDYLLDPERRELRRGEDLIPLEPQALDLLTYLIKHRAYVVTRNELVDAIWGGRIVTDAALTTRINVVRRAIGDDGKSQRLIRTLSRKGLRFVAAVREAARPAASAYPLPLKSTGLAVALLPFVNLNRDAAGDFVAAGTADEIASLLARIGWLDVITPQSGATHTSDHADMARVGRELGVAYLVAGSVRRIAKHLRVTAQLIDAVSCICLWAERIDGECDAIFDLQERVAAAVTGAIEPVLGGATLRRRTDRPEADLPARHLYLRALSGCYSYDATPLLQARSLLDLVLEQEPDNELALAAAAGCRQFIDCAGWADDQALNQRSAVELAQRALQVDGQNPSVLAEAARVIAYFSGDIDAATVMIERALALHPCHARSRYWHGWISLMAGRPDLAIEQFQNSCRLDPRGEPHLTGNGIAYFFRDQRQQAIAALKASLLLRPRWPTTYRFLAASYVRDGNLETARDVISRLRSITSGLSAPISRWQALPFQSRAQSMMYLEGLAEATEAG